MRDFIKAIVTHRHAPTVAAAVVGAVGGYILGHRRGQVVGAQFVLDQGYIMDIDKFFAEREGLPEPTTPDLPISNLFEETVHVGPQVIIEDGRPPEEQHGPMLSGRTMAEILDEHLREEEADLMLEEDEIADAVALLEQERKSDQYWEDRATEVEAEPGSVVDWNWEAERRKRTNRAPYVIHINEFLEDEMGFVQETWTYYAGDGVMVTETDEPTYNWPAMVGELDFGRGTAGVENVVYIRNEALQREWEILWDPAEYRVEVLGEDPVADRE